MNRMNSDRINGMNGMNGTNGGGFWAAQGVRR